MQPVSNNKRIAKNTLFLYIRTIFTMVVSLYTSRIVLAHTVKPDEKTKSETERNKTQKQEEKVLQHEQGGYIRIVSYRKDQTAQEDKQEHILKHTFPYLKGMHFPPVKHYS